jgi:Fe-S cluster biogenesis protein NfuA
MDGGDIKLVDIQDDGTVKVELQGACRGCPMAGLTMASQVECVLKDRVPGVTSVVNVAGYYLSIAPTHITVLPAPYVQIAYRAHF